MDPVSLILLDGFYLKTHIANTRKLPASFYSIEMTKKKRRKSGFPVAGCKIQNKLELVVARKYSTTIGNGSNTSIAVTHNLNTRAVVWQLYDSTSFADVVCDAVRTDANTLTLTFATAPTSGQYTVTVIG